MGTEQNFAGEHKSGVRYLDVATNAHGAEKALLLHRALDRVTSVRPRAVEVGPGGGAAVSYLAEQLAAGAVDDVNLMLIESPGMISSSLKQAIEQFNVAGGSCALQHGLAQDISTIVSEPADVISASALLHEVYSYGGGYNGLHRMMRTLPTVLRPYGFFVYRDVFAVDAPSLHERVIQSYDAVSWLQFMRMFVPQYLKKGVTRTTMLRMT